MTDLREMLEELAGEPAPPSRYDAARVFDAGRRRYRRSRTIGVAAAAILAVATAAGVTGVLVAQDRRDGGRVTDVTGSQGSSDPRPGANDISSQIQWLGAADADRLYLAFLACQTGPCTKEAFDLVGSDDGGRTWTTRTTGLRATGWQVLGRDTLLATGRSGGAARTLVSTDGGRTWSAPAAGTTPVSQVPAGGTVICQEHLDDAPCALVALDPAAGTIAPLANEPAIDRRTVVDVGGRLWVAGVDRTTGRPAVALSTDRGRTWTPHAFDVRTPCSPERCAAPQLATADGRTAYVVVTEDGRHSAFRGVDNAGWQRVDRAELPSSDAAPWAFVAADGAHLVCVPLDGPRPTDFGCQFWALGSGGYQRVALDGLPAPVDRVTRTPDGRFFTHGYGSRLAVYGSSDGRRWSNLTGR